MEKKKLYDIIGIACGLILLLVLIVSHVQANNSQKLDLPSDAQTLTASADGKEGPVEVEVIASPTEIFKVRVVSHTETEGIGTNAVDQLPSAIVDAQSLAVDSVSGATVTSEAIKNAIAAAMTEAGIDPAAFGYEAQAEEAPAEEVAPAVPAEAAAPVAAGDGSYVPGTYTGEGTGMGKVVVNVTVDESAITAVEIDGSGETPEIGGAALGTLSDQVMAAQGPEIDGVAGASLTSEAVRTAVAAALAEAAGGAEEPAAEEPAAAAEEKAASAAEGTVTETGIGQGIDGDVVVQVTADAEKIYSVEVLEQNETPGIGSVAVEQLPDAIVAANTYDVDGVSGATVTSTAIRDAVKMALESAGFDPAAYAGGAAEAAAPAEEEAAEDTVDVNVSKNTKFCSNCGTEVAIETVFCPQCGFRLIGEEKPQTKFCQNCGKKIDINAEICPHCGVRVAHVAAYQEKNALLAAILSFLFPGLGHIYLGLNKKGISFIIAYIVSAILILLFVGIVLCIIVWLWALIDSIKSAEALNRGEFVEDKLF